MNTTGSSSCTQCPTGTFSAYDGSSSCTDCPAGSYSDEQGSSSCTQCPTGTFSAYPASSSCTDCPFETYGYTEGLSVCIECPESLKYLSGIVKESVNDCYTCKYYHVSTNSLTAAINCIAFSPDGIYFATGHTDGNILIWNINDMDNSTTITPINGYNNGNLLGAVTAMVYSDNRFADYPSTIELFSAHQDLGEIIIWDATYGNYTPWDEKLHGSVRLQSLPNVLCLAYCSKTNVLAAGTEYDIDGACYIWQMHQNLDDEHPETPSKVIYWAVNNGLVDPSDCNKYDDSCGSAIYPDPDEPNVTAIAYHGHNTTDYEVHLALGDNLGNITIFKATEITDYIPIYFVCGYVSISSLVYSPDNEYLFIGTDTGDIRSLSVSNCTGGGNSCVNDSGGDRYCDSMSETNIHDEPVKLAYSILNDGSVNPFGNLSSSSSNKTRVWTVTSENETVQIQKIDSSSEYSHGEELAFSPDGTILITSMGTSFSIFQVNEDNSCSLYID